MELLFLSYPFLFTFLLFLFMVLKIANKPSSTNNVSPNLLPPGPRKLPFIGNMHQMMIGSLPHRCLADLAKRYGPLMHLQLGELSTIVISSAETAKEVKKTHDITFSSRPFLLTASVITYDSKDIAFAPYGDYWRQLRKICTLELLSAKRVQSFRSLREEEVTNLIKSLHAHAGSLLNLSEKIFSSTNNIVTKATIGKKCSNQEEFISLAKETVELTGGFNIADLFPSIKILSLISGLGSKLEKIHLKYDRMLDEIIEEHRAMKLARHNGNGEACEDLVDVLLKVQEDAGLEFPFTTDNIKAVVLDIFLAGSETSSTTTEWAILEMLKTPRVMEKAQAEVRRVFNNKGCVDEACFDELTYLKLVIKETMRLHPPVPLLLPRECRERCEINGYEIPIKSRVIVNAWAISRDPEQWVDAESFNPERFQGSSIDYKGANFQYTPFGAGRRMCPGITFGLANIELPLAQLLYHFDWKLPGGLRQEDLAMTEVFGVTVRRKKDLYVIPFPYHPSPIE